MSKHFSAITVFCFVCVAVVMTTCSGTARLEEKSNESDQVRAA